MSTAIKKSGARNLGCVALSLLVGLARLGSTATMIWTWTDGLSLWTAASRRTVAMYRGELRTPPLLARGSDGRSEFLWNSGPALLAYLVRFVDVSGPLSCLQPDPAFSKLQAMMDRETVGVHVRLVTVLFGGDVATNSLQYAAAMGSAHGSRSPSVVSVQESSTSAALRESLALPSGKGDLCIDDIHLIDAHGRVRGLFSSNRWHAAMQSATRMARHSSEPALP